MGRLTERCGNTYVPNENANYEPMNCMDKLGRLENLEEQGYRMVNIGKVTKQLEDKAMKWESAHSQGGFIDLDKAIEIVRTGGK